MKVMSMTRLWLSTCVATLLFAVSASAAHQSVVTATLSDRSLRQMATTATPPAYPESAVKKSVSGVVVASIAVNIDGRVESVEVLESPDAEIARSVQSTLKQWVFRSLTSGPGATDRKRMEGKLIFYFRLVKGEPKVLSADEAAGGAAKPPSAGMTAVGPSVAAPADAVQIHADQLAALLKKGRSVVVDVRDRSLFALRHRSGSNNIPIDELPSRARTELFGVPRVVVDCTEDSLSQCQMAAAMIGRQGVPEIFILVR